jgi:hypothetical protein
MRVSPVYQPPSPGTIVVMGLPDIGMVRNYSYTWVTDWQIAVFFFDYLMA